MSGTFAEQAMSLPLCCAWCGAATDERPVPHIFTCKRCGKQTAAHVADEFRQRRYEAIDKFLGWDRP